MRVFMKVTCCPCSRVYSSTTHARFNGVRLYGRPVVRSSGRTDNLQTVYFDLIDIEKYIE